MKKKLNIEQRNKIIELGNKISMNLIELDSMEKDEEYYQLIGRIFAKALEKDIDFVLGDRWEIKEIAKGLYFQFDLDRFDNI